MLRSRVRRSFTVEVKSKNRQSLSWPETPTPSPVDWAALDPAPETPSPFDADWSDDPAPAAPPTAAEKPRRILQSLIVAEPEPEAPEPEIAREPRLPRVRRAKVPQAPARATRSEPDPERVAAGSQRAGSRDDRAGAIWSYADIVEADDEAPAAPPSIQHRPPVDVAAPPPHHVPRARADGRALGPGERWKRRLPRACR